MNKSCIAVILAGGAGERFWPITTSKPVFPYLGKTFLERAFGEIVSKGVDRVVLVASPQNQKVLTGTKWPVPHTVVLQQKPLGMADALLVAKQHLAHSSLLVLGDDLVDSVVASDILTKAKTSDAFAIVPRFKADRYFPGGYLRLSGDRVLEIVEKPDLGKEPSQFVTSVTHFIRDSDVFLEQLRLVKTKTDDRYEKTLSALAKQHKVLTVEAQDHLISLKYPWHILDVMQQFLGKIAPSQGKNVRMKDNVTLEGAVIIGDNVTIYENTKIVGPCFIGSGTIIGNNNLIRESHIGTNCVTGFHTDITRSYVGSDCWFHANYIGDSVLEGNIGMGSGAVLANLRLDEGEISSVVDGQKVATNRKKLGAMIGRGVRIGVNANIMPGIKIGAGSFVGAGVVLDRDLPDASFCFARPGYEMKKNTKTVSPQARSTFKAKI